MRVLRAFWIRRAHLGRTAKLVGVWQLAQSTAAALAPTLHPMFTGLVEAIGKIRQVHARAGKTIFEVEAPYPDYVLGESIAVDGTCLSVTRFSDNSFEADASLETLQKTTLGQLSVGSPVHLERALRVGDRMGGHIVSGHVDGVASVLAVSALGDARKIVFSASRELMRFVAAKGSVCLSGVSLTVNNVVGDNFDVALIPVTLEKTHFAQLSSGARVNLEVDLMARYAVRWLESQQATNAGIDVEMLKKSGFL